MFKLFFFSLVSSILFYSCFDSTKTIRTKRVPSSISSSAQLRDLISDMALRVEEGTNDPKYCSTELNKAYNALMEMDAVSSGVLDLSKADWEGLINLSFHIRLDIKEKLSGLKVESLQTQECLKSVKDIVRALRYVEDYLVELLYQTKKSQRSYSSLEGSGPRFLINPKFSSQFRSHKDLQSGDILLSRGGAYSSAAIARIGDNDTQFSHLSLVYKNAKGELMTLESLIEVGALHAPLQDFLDYKHARVMVFRHPDKELAHKAAQLMYERIHKRLEDENPIPYDFGMNYSEHSELFCTEVAYEAFFKASDGKVKIPSHTTKFNSGNLPFLNMVGLNLDEERVKTFRTFAPGDIQFDTQFEIVAEYRNPNKLKDSRFKDAILTKVFDWMEEHHYRFDASFKINSMSYGLWIARRVPLVKKLIEERFPMNMNVGQLKTFMILDEVGGPLQKELERVESEADYPLTPKELYGVLDEFRKKDQKQYQEYLSKRKELQRINHGPHSRHVRKTDEMRMRRELKELRPAFHRFYHPEK